MSFDCYDARSFRRQRVKEVAIALALSTAVCAVALFAHTAKAEARPRHYVDANGSGAQVIGSRPSDCPHAWCGCGLRKFLGLADKSLNLAWNWAKKFPRVEAQSGAAAVRRHHVMLLVEHIGGTVWRVRDYNGGRGLAWLHVRDVRGFIFVMPNRSFALN